MEETDEKQELFCVVTLLLVAGLAACGGAAPDVDWTLGVSGAVSEPLSLSYAELADMPQTELNDILMEKSLGEDTTGDWSGVALSEILDKAGAGEFVSITAVAADGYAIEISKDELQDAIVALKENGEWIAEADPDHGPIRLVCPYTPANRWVFQLTDLQVNAEAAGVPDDAAFKIVGQRGDRGRLDRGQDPLHGHHRGRVDRQRGRDRDLHRRAHQRPAEQGRPAGRCHDAGLCRRRWLQRRGGPGRDRRLRRLHRLLPEPGWLSASWRPASPATPRSRASSRSRSSRSLGWDQV